ncbi:adenylate/guanylate cyclase domain-containing protein [Parapedobacter tibetensis]|uniref:adenylate/guanylate cyclase domain-containing protein n=1 Tax=Parapedobacter tibetensis TaxID=2972951 RepID=UPI00214DD240|nr:adenylate/guanylate cyclase domain-containing protein [Parapedobacter tibetensis]
MKKGIQIKLKQLLIIIIVWMMLGFVIAIYDHLILHAGISNGPVESYSFMLSVMRNVGAGLVGALLGGSLLVFYVNVKYRDKPYGYTILVVSISFVFVIAIITLIMAAVIVPLQTGQPLFSPASKEAFYAFVTDGYPLKNGLIWSFIVAVTQLLMQMNSKFGPDTFWNIIKGKYNTPKREERIFMFLDINSSTAIAERLGNEAYHALLKDFFADITDPILENNGNIYQYVGDEVVVVWKFRAGIENIQCLKCFFALKKDIEEKKDKYIGRYGLIPSFKAGIHCGEMVAGEIGIIKRDITYSGDVLNTTSRILGECKSFNEELIVSSDLLAILDYEKDFISRQLGVIKLRGKQQEILLMAIKPSISTAII